MIRPCAMLWVTLLAAQTLAQEMPLPGDPTVGAERFERFECARCHAIGTSDERYGPNLGRRDLRSSFLEGAALMWNTLPAMRKGMKRLHLQWPRLAGDDLLDLVAFYTTYEYYLTRVARPGRPGQGEILFREKGCFNCHSLQPGVKSLAPNLARYGKGSSVMELAQALWNHGPKMQKMLEERLLQRPYFRKRQMADVLAFLATRGLEARSASAYLEPGDPARGAELFKVKQCQHCHPILGVGGGLPKVEGEPMPPDLGRLAKSTLRDYTDIAAVMWNHAVPMWGRMKRQGIPFKPLKDTELADLTAFLFFVNFVGEPGDPGRGGKVFAARGCVSCHELQPGDGRPRGVVPEGHAWPSDWDVVAAMWRAGPAMNDAAEEKGVEWTTLEPKEMADLVAFLRGLSPAGASGRGE